MLAAVSLLAIEPTYAQSIPKPSVPEFSLKYVDRSYTVPANYTYTTNPYNGEQIKTGHGEYRIDNQTIELTIKNQRFSPYKDPNTQTDYQLCYSISWKGHYEESWHYYRFYLSEYTDYSGSIIYGHEASQSEYTIFVFGFGASRPSTYNMQNLGDLPSNSKIDFRVQALFGYYTGFMSSWVPPFRPSYNFKFTGQTSDWSNIQTITLNESSSTPNPSPTVPELPVLALLPLCLILLSVALVLKRRRKI